MDVMTRSEIELPYIEITFRMRRTEDGGRMHPVFSGYRPNWHIGRYHEGEPCCFDGMVQLIGAEKVEPGAEGHARVYPLSPEFWQGLAVGDNIEMCEGPRLIAQATITAGMRSEGR
jgi:hypothetical protein